MPNEAGELGSLALRAAGGLGDRIEELHRAVARRAFEGAGPGAVPAREVHDRIAGGVYGGLRRGFGTLAGAARRIEGGPELSRSPRGRLALGALNGFLGHDLERDGSELAVKMAIRVDEPRGSRVAVFVHGLCETEAAWRFGGGPSYGTRLAADLGFTPVYVDYNTGLLVAENGRRLSAQLDELVASWPVEVEEIVLVGHSMGGLVAHAAACAGGEWTSALSRVVCLGSPHLGAPLEKAAAMTAWAFEQLPETQPLARVVGTRSAGIRDLGFDCLAGELDCDAHRHVAATVSRDTGGVVANVVGDLLVRSGSASAGGGSGSLVGGLTHFHLLNDPGVYETLRDWLSPAGPAAA